MYTDQTKQNPKFSMPVTNNQNSSIPDCAKCPWNLIATLHLAYRIFATFDTRLSNLAFDDPRARNLASEMHTTSAVGSPLRPRT